MITAEEAAQLWDEIELLKEQGMRNLSEDELDAVSGGVHGIDLPKSCNLFFGASSFANSLNAYDDPRDQPHDNKKDDPKDW